MSWVGRTTRRLPFLAACRREQRSLPHFIHSLARWTIIGLRTYHKSGSWGCHQQPYSFSLVTWTLTQVRREGGWGERGAGAELQHRLVEPLGRCPPTYFCLARHWDYSLPAWRLIFIHPVPSMPCWSYRFCDLLIVAPLCSNTNIIDQRLCFAMSLLPPTLSQTKTLDAFSKWQGTLQLTRNGNYWTWVLKTLP